MTFPSSTQGNSRLPNFGLVKSGKKVGRYGSVCAPRAQIFFAAFLGWTRIGDLDGGGMKKIGVCALVLGLSACATVQQSEPDFCGSQQSFERGVQDARQGKSASHSFTEQCDPENISQLTKRYRQGYASEKSRQRQKAVKKENEARFSSLAASAWICEVEAFAKVFTGVGASMDEALKSAKSSCGAHFQASSCNQSDCKKSL
jgi:hypothetical protein